MGEQPRRSARKANLRRAFAPSQGPTAFGECVRPGLTRRPRRVREGKRHRVRGVRRAGVGEDRDARAVGIIASVPTVPGPPDGAAARQGHGPRAREVQGGRRGGELHDRHPRGPDAGNPRGGGDRTTKGSGAGQAAAAGPRVRPERHGRRRVHRRRRHDGRAGVHVGVRQRRATGSRHRFRARG